MTDVAIPGPRLSSDGSPSPRAHVVARLRASFPEVARFGAVGALGAVVDVGCFNVFHHVAGIGPLSSKAASTFLAAVVTYTGNRLWAFRHHESAGVQRDFPLFVLLNVLGLGIAEAVLSFTYYVLGFRGPVATNVAANVVGLGLGTIFRFWAYKRWIFRAGPAPRPAESPQTITLASVEVGLSPVGSV